MAANDTSRPLPQAAPGECVALLATVAEQRRSVLARLARARPDPALLVTGHDPLFPQLDVSGNVAFPLRRRSIARRDRQRLAADLMALAGLEPIARRSVRDLGAAWAARVRVARAFASGRPLVLDDPFAASPANERPALQTMLRRLVRQHAASVVLAAADRAEIFACGDRIGVIENDAVERVDQVPAILAAPGSALAARALLDAELFAGRVADDAGHDDEADVSLACGVTMGVRLAEQTRPGDLCLVAVRPDQIAFAAMRAVDLGGRAIPATLIDTSHFGDHLRLRFRLEDGSQATVRRPPASVTPRDLARACEPLGASLAWRWPDAMAYPHPQA